MEKLKIERINALAHKQKTPEGLTAEEREEQRILRQEFLADFRARFTNQLENLDVEYVEDLNPSKNQH